MFSQVKQELIEETIHKQMQTIPCAKSLFYLYNLPKPIRHEYVQPAHSQLCKQIYPPPKNVDIEEYERLLDLEAALYTAASMGLLN